MINPAMEERKARLEKVSKMLNDMLPINFKKALSIIQVNTGASYETARDYLNTVITFNELKIENGIIKKDIEEKV